MNFVPCYKIDIPKAHKTLLVKGNLEEWMKIYKVKKRKLKNSETRYYIRGYLCYITPLDPEVMLRMMDIFGDPKYDPTIEV